MRSQETRRRTRQPRPLPYTPGSPPADGPTERDPLGPRSLFCVDLRAVTQSWSQRPVEEIRRTSRGGRLGALLAGLDLDPRRSLQRNAGTLMPARAQQLFDALCEELAEGTIYDIPRGVWLGLLPLLAPHGQGDSPYPADGTLPQGGELAGGLVVISEGRLAAEASSLALSRAAAPPLPPQLKEPGGEVDLDRALWADIVSALLPMLETVRDQQRVLLIEA